MVDDAKLHQFIGQMLSDLGGAASIALVRIGDSLGLYKAMHEHGPMTVAELAATTQVHERYLREWLSHQAASNYLAYDPATGKFSLPPEQAMVFAIEDSPVFMPGAFGLMASMLDNQAKVEPAFRTGAGVAWGDQAGCLFCAVARFFRPGYVNNIVANWLPARRRRRQARTRRQSRRCRLRPRRVDRADGAGLSEFRICRLRLPPLVGRTGRAPCPRPRGRR